MQLDLKKVFQREGFRLPIELTVDLSEEDIYGAKPFSKPVTVTGYVENQNEIVMLRYSAEVVYTRECDRCLELSSQQMCFSFEHIITAGEIEDNTDEIIFAEDFRLLIDDVVREDVLLEVPTRYLCKQECKGLCPKCGCNLNHTACGCDLSEPDPRLAALRKLLEE